MHRATTKQQIAQLLPSNRKLGFVPTMGALHDGHISLIAASKNRGLFTVASIFVNPTQFNNSKDFEKYPIDTEKDCELLANAGCDLVFLPPRDEIYPDKEEASKYIHDFGPLESRLEGAFRPGHFRGVGQVVHILFDIVRPDYAFFGEKDFQQLQIIRALESMLDQRIEVVGMPTIRENDGLAMSSRNRRLNPDQRRAGGLIYKALCLAKSQLKSLSLDVIRREVADLFEHEPLMQLEYFDIVDPTTFESRKSGDQGPFHAVIAAYAGEVRLIDNMRLD
ncbi:MAG: pantoate--beta-alanine ligase [Cryomorphaceae bacterium]